MWRGDGIRKRFAEVVEAKKHADESIEGGRAFARCLVITTALLNPFVRLFLMKAGVYRMEIGHHVLLLLRAWRGQRTTEGANNIIPVTAWATSCPSYTGQVGSVEGEGTGYCKG